jgi:hypothetical protein
VANRNQSVIRPMAVELMLWYPTLTIPTLDTPSQRTSILPTFILQGLAAWWVWHPKCQYLAVRI